MLDLSWVWSTDVWSGVTWGMRVNVATEEFDQKAEAAWSTARQEALANGFPVFYRDTATGLQTMEQPDGRCLESARIAGAPAGRNYKVLREMASKAA